MAREQAPPRQQQPPQRQQQLGYFDNPFAPSMGYAGMGMEGGALGGPQYPGAAFAPNMGFGGDPFQMQRQPQKIFSYTGPDITLQMKPHFDILYSTISKFAATQPGWMLSFSLTLDIDMFRREHIASNNSRDIAAELMALLKEWLTEPTDPPPTKFKILKTLRKVMAYEAADELDKKL